MSAAFYKKSKSKAEGESPFWISFSDLMTALMTLFLVVMAVTLISITQGIPATIAREATRQQDIAKVMSRLKRDSKQFAQVKVDEANFRIDLGEIVRFNVGSSAISPDAGEFLRKYVPVLLEVTQSPEGKWIKRYVVEGFTDQDGTYTYNLRLSLDRSLSVICALSLGGRDTFSLNTAQLRQIQEKFLVGGFSFNSIKEDKAASRRVELRVEFLTLDESDLPNRPVLLNKEFGAC